MTVFSRPWLPETAYCSNRIKPILDRAIDDWSARWFPESTKFSATQLIEGLARKIGGKEQCFSIFGGQLAITKSAEMDAQICQELLGYDQHQVTISPGDQIVLDEIAKASIEDLKQELCMMFDVAYRSADSSAELTSAPFNQHLWSCKVKDVSGKIEFSLALGKDMVIESVKSRIPATSGKEALSQRLQSIGNVRVKVGAHVGTSKLTVSEMTQLEVGDVLVLDKDLESPMNLTINGDILPQRLILNRNTDRLALQVKK